MAWIGQADEWDVVFCPITAVGIGAIGANRQDFRVTRGKGRIIISQAVEMGAAIGSHESAQKNKDDVFFAFEIRKAQGLAAGIL